MFSKRTDLIFVPKFYKTSLPSSKRHPTQHELEFTSTKQSRDTIIYRKRMRSLFPLTRCNEEASVKMKYTLYREQNNNKTKFRQPLRWKTIPFNNQPNWHLLYYYLLLATPTTSWFKENLYLFSTLVVDYNPAEHPRLFPFSVL